MIIILFVVCIMEHIVDVCIKNVLTSKGLTKHKVATLVLL